MRNWYPFNSFPTASTITLAPNSPNTTNDLELTWIFFDADYDNQSIDWIIVWRRSGIIVAVLENFTTIPASYTSKGESWEAQIWVFDGFDYSLIDYISNNEIIQNTPMTITDIVFSDLINNSTYANGSLAPAWNVIDADNDGQVDYRIYWYWDNGSGLYVYRVDFDLHIAAIPSSELVRGQSWYCVVQIYDGQDWSISKNSSVILIINAPPRILDLTYVFDSSTSQVKPDIRTDEFYVEDENITLSYYFSDIDSDSNHTKIIWFKRWLNGSWVEQTAFEDQTVISSLNTSSGEQWYALLTPNDGSISGVVVETAVITIFSRPLFYSYDVLPEESSEGIFTITINTSDISHTLDRLEFDFVNIHMINQSFSGVFTGGYWVITYTLEDLSLLNTNVSVVIKATVNVPATEYEIFSLLTFTFLLEDKAPPRISDAYFLKNDDYNPTNLTFYAIVEEFGSGIAEVLLNYSYVPVTANGENGGGAGLTQEHTNWTTVSMEFVAYNESTNSNKYSLTVPFDHKNSDMEILYIISTLDNDDNYKEAAFDIRDYPQRVNDQRFVYQPPGLPEWVLLVAGLAVVLVFFGAIVYVKFIRKPELVGLDKELVLETIQGVSEQEIIESLDTHTLGTVISFFDQRHGPIPIIIIPIILKDNFNKLVELSDRSFSGTGFCENFTAEIPSSYDFVLAEGLRTSVLSFGFALNRPEARGGKENLTLNLIVHSEVFPLVQSFQKVIQRKVHAIHLLMDKSPSEKEKIEKLVLDLRKYVSAIVLSYVQIYGTIELLESEDDSDL